MLQTLGVKYNTDKATYHNFTKLYDMVLGSRKHTIRTVIEYGILQGASLRMWREYFPESTHIYAFDINLKGDPRLPHMTCAYANQDSRESLVEGLKNVGVQSADIIVEDGGHMSTQQRNTLAASWPILASGGIYILEDLHTNIKHWYPNNPYYNESPTMYDDLHKASLGLPNSLPINSAEIQQILFFMQPASTSMTCVVFKK